jgi:DNA-binding NtrC family response regulator
VTLLALVPRALTDAVEGTAGSLGCEAHVTASLSDFLSRLDSGSWLATLVSFSADTVDERVIERIAHERGVGTLLLSAPGASLERALLADRLGAAALLREPLRPEDLGRQLALLGDEGREVPVPDVEPDAAGSPAQDLVAEGPAMAEVFERIARVARSGSTVLVTGESGTGKEMVARALHQSSDRADGPFVAVNCAAIPEHLLESELFGHERGAFTGAVASRVGRFERAHGGSLLLDEIGDMSLVLQSKLLRVLEERTVEPVGGSGPRPVDVRVIAATHQDLRQRIEEGLFREDLYYRLAVVDISLPSLRTRGSDIRALALHFAGRFAGRHGRPIRAVTEKALARLEQYDWPGNVRELRNVMDRAVLLANGPVLRTGHLRLGEASPRTSPLGAAAGLQGSTGYPTTFSLEQVEADHIARVLAETGGHIGDAAEVLGVHRNTLGRKIRQYGIDVPGGEV